MSPSWNNYPLFRFCICLILGIWASDTISLVFTPLALILFLSLTVYIGTWYFWPLQSWLRPYIFGITSLLFFFSLGALLPFLHIEKYDSEHIMHVEEAIEAWKGQVISYPEQRPKHERAVLNISHIRLEGQWQKAKGKIQVYFPKDTVDVPRIQYGEQYIVKALPRIVSPPANPNEFDYQQFLARQNIYHQVFLHEGQWIQTGEGQGKPLLHVAYSLRTFYSKELSKHIQDPEVLAIAKALLLGLKDGLDHDLKEAFSAAGAMHILAVSGLHVGIIFMVLATLLSRWKYAKQIHLQMLYLFISLGVLWLYVLLAGASASVIRAGIMFSLFVITQSIRRRSNIYNTLALAAIFMLLLDSQLLFTVGFQLSFAAVLGIVFFQPPISRLLHFEGRIPQYLWELTAVSFAAQLATFPLGILYFHRFPSYFLLSNLFVIPGAFLVLFLGVGFFLSAWLPFASALLGKALHLIIALINKIVYSIEAFPYSSIQSLWASNWQILLLYGILLSIGCALIGREKKWLLASLGIALLWAVHSTWLWTNRLQTDQLIFYHVAGFSQVDRLQSGYYTPRLLDGLPAEKEAYHLQGHRLRYAPLGIWPQEPIHPAVMNWKNQVFLFLEQDSLPVPEQLQVDYLILGKDRIQALDQLPANLNFQTLIIDGSNSRNIANRLKSQAMQANLSHHSILHEGALTLK